MTAGSDVGGLSLARLLLWLLTSCRKIGGLPTWRSGTVVSTHQWTLTTCVIDVDLRIELFRHQRLLVAGHLGAAYFDWLDL